MIFVELTPFLEFRRAHCSDEKLRALQNNMYLVFYYTNNEQDNLTSDQVRQLAKIVGGVMKDE